MKKLFLLVAITSFIINTGCKKTIVLIEGKLVHDTVKIYVNHIDTVIKLKHDTLFKTWRDTVLKIVKDSLYKTKHDTLYITKYDTVTIIHYVPATNIRSQVFFAGTSITFGAESIVAPNVPVAYYQKYPYIVGDFFAGSKTLGGWSNLGIAGATVSTIINNEFPIIYATRDVINYSRTVVCIEEGINDYRTGQTAAMIYAAIKYSHGLLQDKGIKTIVFTPTASNLDAFAYNLNSVADEAVRQQLIVMLVKGWKTDIGAIGIIDFNTDLYVGKYTGSIFNNSIFQCDGLHFTPLGNYIIAADVEKTLFNL